MNDFLETEEFYEVCQHYRHAQDISLESSAAKAFESLKEFIRHNIAQPQPIRGEEENPFTPDFIKAVSSLFTPEQIKKHSEMMARAREKLKQQSTPSPSGSIEIDVEKAAALEEGHSISAGDPSLPFEPKHPQPIRGEDKKVLSVRDLMEEIGRWVQEPGEEEGCCKTTELAELYDHLTEFIEKNPAPSPSGSIPEPPCEVCKNEMHEGNCPTCYINSPEDSGSEKALGETKEELAGDFLKRLGTDGKIWAEEFCKQYPQCDLEHVYGWFANAIMTGHDWGQKLAHEKFHRQAKEYSGSEKPDKLSIGEAWNLVSKDYPPEFQHEIIETVKSTLELLLRMKDTPQGEEG